MWFPLGSILSTALLIHRSYSQTAQLPQCRILPTDAAWPNASVWNAFNTTLGGRLIKTVPIGSVCHDPTFNQGQCNNVQDNWHAAALHIADPTSVMDPAALNNSCNPFFSEQTPCLIGAYPQYAVNATEPEHVIDTLNFVRAHNIRFVVKNTGHDYSGRSVGTGSVSVWTHNMNNITFIENYTSTNYSGPAFTVGAGVNGGDLESLAHDKGFLVVAGECPSTGIAGGVIQGGGHSVVSSVFGLAADQALSWQVVTTDGNLITASPEENSDLFWALSGGGAGTYGVVISVTVKVYPDVPVTAGVVQFTAQGLSQDTYWSLVSTYMSISTSFPSNKIFTFAIYSNSSFFMPVFGVNRTVQDVTNVFQPLTAALGVQNITNSTSLQTFPTFLDAFNSEATFQNSAVAAFQIGNRLIPTSFFNGNSSVTQLVNVIRSLADSGAGLLDVTVSPTLQVAGNPNNAVLPAWRENLHIVFVTLPLSNTQSEASMVQDQMTIANTLLAPLRQLTPQSGSYMNEGALLEPNFKTAYYGSNYNRLLSIKDKYDPSQLMYGSINVGGDRWAETTGGRLCRTGATTK